MRKPRAGNQTKARRTNSKEVEPLRQEVREELSGRASLEEHLDLAETKGGSDKLGLFRESLNTQRAEATGKHLDDTTNDGPVPTENGPNVLLAAAIPPAPSDPQTTGSPSPATGSTAAAPATAAPAQAAASAAQTPPPAPPAPLPTPAITGPLANLPPAIFDAGPFGKIAVNGIVSGFGMWQDDPRPRR